MSTFDSNILSIVNQLDSITDEIISTLSNRDNLLEKVDSLYNSRSEYIDNIEKFMANSNNQNLIEKNRSEWNNMINPLKAKDERAFGLLKNRIKAMEEELKSREKQKNVLLYKENK